MAKVNLNLEIDVQDAFLALSQSEKEEFSAKNIDYIGCISDVALLAEIERRGLN